GTAANFNSAFYSKVFEVILRMKGNYLWPAMWNNAFAEDDPDNPRIADEYGVVMGSSHQEPMLRAQKEWDWHLRAANGNWNYATQANILDDFWREGVEKRKDYESIYTMGLRGENDSAMVRTPAEGVALTEKIVADQRKILSEVVNPDVTKIPQLWALYKEVQGYYENGLRVPDDITLLWAEDNWGNVRRLPTPEERKRSGGAGIYYHFDYHGGPRSYQWVNTSPINKIWEQMSLAKQYGDDRIWIVNVGHFKGYEIPTEFFLNLGWNTDRWKGSNVNDFTRQWAEREFGAAYATEVAAIVDAYTDFNARRKPELLEPGTYSLVNYREAERVESDYDALAARAEALYAKVPADKRDAFFQLVLFPVKACANLNAMYVAAGRNALYASQGRADANAWADKVKARFADDAALTKQWDELEGGKWVHFMEQPHIGYRSWADPPANTLAAIKLAGVEATAEASLGIAADGGSSTLPAFDSLNQQRSYVDVFNKGRAPFDFTATASAPWIVLSASKGRVDDESRIWVTIDWAKAPAGVNPGSIKIAGAGREETVQLSARKPAGLTRATLNGFAEGAGYVAIDAAHYSAKTDAGQAAFVPVEQYGMLTHAPVDVAGLSNGPHLDYRVYLFTPGEETAKLKLGPALNFAPDRPVRIAVSMDDETPQVLTIVPKGYDAGNGNRDWEQSVRDNARYVTSKHQIAAAGYHTFNVWMVDPGVVLERIVIDTPASAKAASYLGPPESYRHVAAVGAAAKQRKP
ncbi:MAG TPA: glycosyl hydrolase 115 family protein, partial [Bryobacteraceae bacterium]|nr:glycosyl hydrolase 115 family protein [Bryobacteraceae bacterium]